MAPGQLKCGQGGSVYTRHIVKGQTKGQSKLNIILPFTNSMIIQLYIQFNINVRPLRILKRMCICGLLIVRVELSTMSGCTVS